MKDDLAERRARKGIATITLSVDGKKRLVRDVMLAADEMADPLAGLKARAKPKRKS